jgi:hypothetical protein
MSSLDSHTIVPTLTMFGRVREWIRLESKPGAVAVEVTLALWPDATGVQRSGWAVSDRFNGRRAGVVPGPDTIGR